MGTTLVLALIVADRVYIASVGDSRAYRIDAVQICATQLTTDHSLVARLVGAGQITCAEAGDHPQRSTLYRAIGMEPAVEVDTQMLVLKPHDLLLLCSDGLVAHIEDHELARIALEQPDPDRACARLVTLANARGGDDNISVVIVRTTR
jgi:protein phosphatase